MQSCYVERDEWRPIGHIARMQYRGKPWGRGGSNLRRALSMIGLLDIRIEIYGLVSPFRRRVGSLVGDR